MADYVEIHAIASDGGYQQRVRTAAVKAALQILGEAPGTMSPTKTGKRQQMAASVLQGGQNWFNWSLALILSNATLQTNGLAASDGDIDFVLPSIWDDMSGVTAAEGVAVQV